MAYKIRYHIEAVRDLQKLAKSEPKVFPSQQM